MMKIITLTLICSLLFTGCGGGAGGGISGGSGTISSGMLTGRLLDEQNWGMKGGIITLNPGNYSCTTDGDGFFTFSVPENHYKITIRYNNETFNPDKEVEVIRDKTVTIGIKLSSFEGFIISHPYYGLAFVKNTSSINLEELGYSGLSGVEISLSGSSSTITTDSRGYFKYDRVISGIQTLEALYESKNIREDIVVTSNKDINNLEETSAIPENVSMLTGSVRQFTAYGRNSRNELVLPEDVKWSMSDKIGSISSDGVFIAKTIGKTEVTGVFGNNTVKANVIVTSGTGSVKGKVLDANGKPVTNVIVSVSGVNIFDVTDENGEYSLSKIPANLNILLSVSDGGNLLASKTVFILPDNTLTEDIIINSSGSTPVPSPSSSGHPVHNSILTTFSVGNSPKGIVISKDGMKGYVATEMGTYIFSTVTNQVENIIKTGAGSKKICLYDNRAYVTNNSTDDIKISCLNTVDNSIIDTFLMPKYPFDINVSPDGKKLYVANEDQTLSSVYVIDTGTKSISTIPVSKIPHGLEISPDGKRLYTTSMVTDTTPVDIVSVIDTETSSVIKTISVGAVPYEIALSPDGKKAYVSNSGGIGDGKEGISVIDTTTNSLVTTINLIGTPLSLRVSPDGSRLFVTHFDEQVTIIDTSSNNIITTLSLSKTVGEDIIFSPDGLKAYITTSGGGGIVNIIY